MQFQKIIGQGVIKQNLIQTTKEGRISHTQLFLGPEGCGNLALAIAYSQYINCLAPTDTDSCGTCSSCVKFEKLIHPDLHFSFPTISPHKYSNELLEEWRKLVMQNPYINEYGWLSYIDSDNNKQGNITALECRDIIRKLGLYAYEAKYKTVIIWMPEKMEKEGNILLKLLEEPPEKTLILLVANDAEKVLPTILSRTQLLKVPKLKHEEMVDALMRNFECDEGKAQSLARLADGNYDMAIRLLDVGHEDYFNIFQEWMRACWQKKMDDIIKFSDTLSGGGREYIKSFFVYSLQMIRASFVYKYGSKDLVRLSAAEQDFVTRFSNQFTPANLPLIVQAFNDSITQAQRNANVRIMVLNLSLYIGTLLRNA